MARAEADAGHRETALDFYFRATVQHAGPARRLREQRREALPLRGGAPLLRFDQVKAPAELWVFADQHHMPSIVGGDSGTNNWAAPLHGAMCDWLRDRFDDKPLRHAGQAIYVEANSAGPNAAKVTLRRRWYE
jgi:hypothetical protein